MQSIDLAIVGVYLILVIWLGARCSRRQTSIDDYFLAKQQVPWWALMASIVATETSTITLISVPGYAFGGDFTFLQIALGYLIGRVLVSVLLLPAYFRGKLLTVYQLIGQRFSPQVGRLAASIFLFTRCLSDGFRLFATGLVGAAVLASIPAVTHLTGAMSADIDENTILVSTAITLIGTVTLAYTLLGGMRAVVWTDLTQLIVYLTGSSIVGLILLNEMPSGWIETATSAGKFRLFDFALDATKNYTFWSAVIGGIFLTCSTHGTDQLLVQRYLSSRSISDAQRALVVSGFVVFVQFALLLTIGTMLWTYYATQAPDESLVLMADGKMSPDQVFPMFMIANLPTGVRGLMVASIVAAAMSTMSSSLNSLAASTVGDFYIPWTDGSRSDRHYLTVSKGATVAWGGLQLTMAFLAMKFSSRVIDEVLGLQSLTGGLILGLFLLGFIATRRSAAAGGGVLIGIVVMLLVYLSTPLSWQWYAAIGSLTTLTGGWLTDHAINYFGRKEYAG